MTRDEFDALEREAPDDGQGTRSATYIYYSTLRVIGCLEGRRDMNLRTAALHPDPSVRAEALARAAAYRQAAEDVAELLSPLDET